jgi:hypothetical protein
MMNYYVMIVGHIVIGVKNTATLITVGISRARELGASIALIIIALGVNIVSANTLMICLPII